MASPTIDTTLGTPTTNGFIGGTSSTFTPGNVSTAGTNELVCLYIAINSASWVSSISGAGLTWTLAYRTQTPNGTIDLWTAPAASVVNFNSQTITVTWGQSASRWNAVLFAVQGLASLTNPFDTFYALPAQGVTASGTPPTLTYSTTQSDDLLVFLSSPFGSTASGGTPAGWTGTFTGVPSNPPQGHIYTKSVSAAQSGQTVADASATSTSWAGLLVAFTADSVAQPTNAPRLDPIIPVTASAGLLSSNPWNVTPGNFTTSANALQVLAIGYASTSASVSSVVTSGLTWTKRSRITGTGVTVEIWTAPASSAFNWNGLSAAITLSSTIVRFGAALFSVIGTDAISTPFDGHAGLPDSASNSSSATPPAVTFSTTHPDDLLLFYSDNPNSATPATPSGWWNLFNINSSNFDFALNMLRVNSAQAAATVADASATSGTWLGVVDALTADISAETGTAAMGFGPIAIVATGQDNPGPATGGLAFGPAKMAAAGTRTETASGKLAFGPPAMNGVGADPNLVGTGKLAFGPLAMVTPTDGRVAPPAQPWGPRASSMVVYAAILAPPAKYVRNSKQDVLVAGRASTSDTTNVVPRLSLLTVYAAFSTGIPNQVRTAAWTYTMDGHTFYVLNLGPQGTFVYDQVTQQWAQFDTDGYGQWNMNVGTQWQQKRVVGGDSITGQVWELDPTAVLDEGWRDLVHIATGGIMSRSRVYHSVDSVRIAGSVGIIDEVNGATFNLTFSDDQGATWSDPMSVTLTEANYTMEIAFRSLGAFAAPGRIFQVQDLGGIVRIDGMDAFIDNFDEENVQPREDARGR